MSYFDKKTNILLENYKIHWREFKKPEVEEVYESLHQIYIRYLDVQLADVIIEFCGKNLFLWTVEGDRYVIFGDKNLIERIDEKKYSIEQSMKFIQKKNDNHEKEFFEKFIKKYNVSF